MAKKNTFVFVYVLIFGYCNSYNHNHNHNSGQKFPSVVNQVIRNATTVSISNNTQMGDRHRIIGGVETQRNEFPFIVSFARHRRHFCGGSIISPEWVLTAAHCASEPDFSVTAGEHNLEANEGSEQTSKAIKVIRHPHYNPITFEDDICLIKISPPFVYDKFVQPFSVPSTHYVANGNATVSGWGTEDEAFQVVSPVLRKVTVPIVESLECSRQYGRNFVPHKMICAGEEEGGKDSDACQGDSGGPLMCDDYHKGATLCGVVSFGLGCARPELAGVYTKVAYYSDWIEYEIRNSDSDLRVPTTPRRPGRRPETTTAKPTEPAPHKPGHNIPPGYIVIIKPANSTKPVSHRDPNKRSGSSTVYFSRIILLAFTIFSTTSSLL